MPPNDVLYSCTLTACKNCFTKFKNIFFSLHMHAILFVSCFIKTWSSVCLMAPHLQSDKRVRPHCAWTNGIAQH